MVKKDSCHRNPDIPLFTVFRKFKLSCQVWKGLLMGFAGYFLLYPSGTLAQTHEPKAVPSYRMAFYNVENLFDTKDDTLKRDEEYLPGGLRGWNDYKLNQKIVRLYKTIAALGEWQPLTLLALAEVENRQVLEQLIDNTPLQRFQYQIVHEESPDERGVDVAVLYRPDQFEVLDYCSWPVYFPFEPENKTRDLLYVKGILQEKDTFHLIVNHWPSRWGGAAASEKYRMQAARTVSRKIDSLMNRQAGAHVVLTGDFNDEPEDKSLQWLTNRKTNGLVNISASIVPGTIKHEAAWAVFDQFIVSDHLLQKDHAFIIQDQTAKVFHPDWLLEKDEKYAGFRLNRTYLGFRYHGGFSDHLPVYIDLIENNNIKTEEQVPY